MDAINAPSVIAEMPEKPVQELARAGSGGGDDNDNPRLVPQRYIYKKTSDADPAFNVSLPLIDCPTINLGLLASSSEVELDKLRSALTSWGCFQIVNHGISSASLDEMRRVIKQFFELPLEEKKKYSRATDDPEGYGTDTFVSENRVQNWTDRLYFLTHPVNQRRMHLWPQKPASLRENLHQFTLKTEEILQILLKAMATSLGMAENESFLKRNGHNGRIFARLSMYPRCPLPERVLGLHEHTDMSSITILLQDDRVEGLQVLKDNQWFKVPATTDALFINAGDQLEIMSNGIFKSPMHRVVTSAKNERISLAVLCCPDADEEIKPLEELITADKPQMYKMVKNYADFFTKHYQSSDQAEEALSTVRF